MSSSKTPMVSIIVPIYNVKEYIRKCVESILNQTYRNLEIILVDDGSPDDCPKICDEYAQRDNRVKVIHKSNGGLSDARNAGIDAATGEYLTFIDSDDYYAPSTIEMMVKAIQDNEIGIVCMGAVIVNSDYLIMREEKLQDETVSANEYFKGICNGTRTPSVCTKLIKKDIICGNRFKENRLNEDFYFSLALLMKPCKVRTIPFSGYYYYQREGSISHSGNKKSLYDAIQNCIDYIVYTQNESADLTPYVARMGIHQASVMVRVIPEKSIDRNNENLCKALECLQLCRPYIFESQLPIHEKMIAWAVLLFPVTTTRTLRTVRRIVK